MTWECRRTNLRLWVTNYCFSYKLFMLLHRYRMKSGCLSLLVLLCFAVFLLNKSNVFRLAPTISVFRRMIHRHPRPIFPINYHSTGLLRLPHGNIKEPFEIWFTSKYQRSRVDFYYGKLTFSSELGARNCAKLKLRNEGCCNNVARASFFKEILYIFLL